MLTVSTSLRKSKLNAVSAKGFPYRIEFGGPDIRGEIPVVAAPDATSTLSETPDSDEHSPAPSESAGALTASIKSRAVQIFEVDWRVTSGAPAGSKWVAVSPEITQATGIKGYLLYRIENLAFNHALKFYGPKKGLFRFFDEEGDRYSVTITVFGTLYDEHSVSYHSKMPAINRVESIAS
ncbi:hypothetical protein FA15DRAFT_658191 [Coprinopsis marcescibilis]|uniref:Uncharacterized protein n=1 Tax=Coprinopsis marcescibilis TaxID=230819 RepID=A0A5C3KMU3_COPMA|nr:hypothetical protein FA15DRAFT_658191 [Coprinopsis marcescibilis]